MRTLTSMLASSLMLVLLLLVPSAGSTAAPVASPQLGPCAPGSTYDPACDVNHDNTVNILDVQLTAGHWGQSGPWVGDNDHDHLGQTWFGTNNPLYIAGSFGNPYTYALALSNTYSTGDGLRVPSAGNNGVDINTVGNSGVSIGQAGNNGVSIGSTGSDGVYVFAAGGNGFNVHDAGINGVFVGSADLDGMFVSTPGRHGVNVYAPVNNGVNVQLAGGDGVYVGSAGTPSTAVASSGSNGFEVAGAEGYGLYVGRADADGVQINQAGDDGVQLGNGTDFPYYGLYVPEPGTTFSTLLPNTANDGGQWALYTVDNIEAGNVFLSAQTLVAVVGGDQPLTVGDVVAAVGLADPLPGSLNRLAQVRLATVEQANIVGVVSSRMALQPLPGKDGEQALHSVGGPAQPGDYVAITVLGAAQVKVQADAAIQPGQRLTAAETPGQVRPLRTVRVEGVELDERGPVLGIALEAGTRGLLWVLVNPQ